MSVYAYMQNAEQKLVVVQDGKILEGEDQARALEFINQTLLTLLDKTKLAKETFMICGGKRLAHLKHSKSNHVGRVCYAILIYDNNENPHVIAPSAQALGFESAKIPRKFKWLSCTLYQFWAWLRDLLNTLKRKGQK
ncbi:hypothetical protein [Helicobacter mehlei]|uniref:Uncharacterized protein n=1 Tax=Helicobacter mehlei TaxID=2316080 RepID=A0A553V341_9HELI|nr:hypothetical protein [Helicobacter mehlei]TSA86899.1 hypothetical protein FNE76_00015 [Helicobacter mehlei]